MNFYDAICSSDWSVSVVGRLLDEGTDINEKGDNGDTVLHAAITEEKWDTVNLLIDRGADVNIKNDDWETPLHHAGSKGPPEITAMLLKAGAVVNCANQYYETPLHCAARRNTPKIAAMLLKAGADVNYKSNIEETPLYYAATNNNPKITEMLLKAGAVVNYESCIKKTPLHCAARNSNRKIAEMLLEAGAVVKIGDFEGKTPLHIAATNRIPEIAALFLKTGLEVNCTATNGETPLHYAAREGCLETAALLLESGASVNSKDKEGQTPLHYAGQYIIRKKPISNTILTAKLLVENGGNVNCVDIHGRSPLHYAAGKCNAEITALLLESGANVNCIDFKGRTPLHVVGQYTHDTYGVEVLDRLLCAGARLDNKLQKHFRFMSFSKLRIFLNIRAIIQLFSANIHKNICNINVDAMIFMNVQDSYDRSELQSFKYECIDEIKKMKRKAIGNLSLFGIFSDSPYPFVSKAEEIEKVLDLAERQDEYPIYIKLMKYRFKRAVRRKALMDEAMDILPSLNPALALPELGQMILAWLSEREMTALIKAVEIEKRNDILNVFNHLGPDLFLV